MVHGRNAIALLFSLAFSGCTINANLNTGYRPWPPVEAAPLDSTIAVKRFAEARPPRVYSTGGRAFATYIPFLPYVSLPYERLDESARKAGEEVGMSMPPFEQYTYPASMARAIAEDLRASGRFAKVDYVGDDATADHRYVLSGAVRASPLEKDLTSYGLGAAGVLLWFLPIPIGQTWASVTVDLTLTDQTAGEEIWRTTLRPEVEKRVWLYTSAPTLVYGGVSSFDLLQVPEDAEVDRESLFSWHFALLRRAMADVPRDIAAAMDR